MEADIRRKLEMVERALRFERTHPATDSSHRGVVAALAEVVARIDAVFAGQKLGLDGERAATTRRRTIRKSLRLSVTHLCRVAAYAERREPFIAGRFLAPRRGAPNRDFITVVKVLLQEAAKHEAVLVASGLGDDFMEACRTAVADFEREGETASSLRSDHVLASAEFRELAREGVQLVGVLDGLNTARFREAPEELTAWRSARRVEGRRVRREEGEGREVNGDS
jgi:hypothetical protein